MNIAKQINRQRPLGIVYMTVFKERENYKRLRGARSFVDHGTWGGD